MKVDVLPNPSSRVVSRFEFVRLTSVIHVYNVACSERHSSTSVENLSKVLHQGQSLATEHIPRLLSLARDTDAKQTHGPDITCSLGAIFRRSRATQR